MGDYHWTSKKEKIKKKLPGKKYFVFPSHFDQDMEKLQIHGFYLKEMNLVHNA